MGVKAQTYVVDCRGERGRKVQFVSEENSSRRVLVVEIWAEVYSNDKWKGKGYFVLCL